MSRKLAVLALAALLAFPGCGSAPPRGAIEDATKQVTNNPELKKIFGDDYKATYTESGSLRSASVGTRVNFDLIGSAGSGNADVQYGYGPEEGPWVPGPMSVTFNKRTTLRLDGGAWKPQ